MSTNWKQIDIPKDAFLSLLNNKFISDVKFRFTDGRILFAHSFVLCCRSRECYNLFVANFGVSKLIDVRDYTYEEFYEFLKHLYTNTCQVDEATVEGVMKLSKQHSLPELKTQCADVMIRAMNVSNTFDMLEMCIESEVVETTKKVTDFISRNYFEVLSQDSFLKVNNMTLQLILKLDPVSDADEFKVFERVMEWAAQVCLTESIEVNGCNKRAKLGNNLKLIRFGSMSIPEFTKCHQLEPGLLEDREVISVYQSIGKPDVNPFGFLNKKRCQMDWLDSVEFHDPEDVGDLYQTKKLLSNFRVSHSITLKQIILFQMDNIMKFEIKLLNASENLYEHHEYGPFTGILNPNLKLQPNIQYRVMVEYLSDKEKAGFRPTTIQKSKRGRYEFILFSNDDSMRNRCIKELIFIVNKL